MNRANPQCRSCTAYIEKGPRRCTHVYPRYIKFRDEFCPCVKCAVKPMCGESFRRYDWYPNNNCCPQFKEAHSKFCDYIVSTHKGTHKEVIKRVITRY